MQVSPATFRRTVSVLACAGALMATAAAPATKGDKPSISVKASPNFGFAPMRIVLTADVQGGPDDYQDFYCASVEWDLGDGNKAEQKADCDPYEPGKSLIKRRYVKEQVFNIPGEFRVRFLLKQKNKVVGSGNTTVRVRPGVRDIGD